MFFDQYLCLILIRRYKIFSQLFLFEFYSVLTPLKKKAIVNKSMNGDLEPDELLPRAETVGDQIMKVEVPEGKFAGDTFIVTTPDGQMFSVKVPEDAVAGSYIDIIVPGSIQESTKPTVTLKKSTVGAVLTAGAVGLVLGPIGALVMAGGALAAVSSQGKVGETSRKYGEKVYNGAADVKNWTVKKASEASEKVQKTIHDHRHKSGESANQSSSSVSYSSVEDRNGRPY